VSLHDTDRATGVQRILGDARPFVPPSVPEPEAPSTQATAPSTAPAPSIEDAIEDMIARQDEPDLVFQPIVDLQRGLNAGYEVLARFRGPPHATPDRWFIAAHAMGRGVELEALVIERALSQRRWLPESCFLSINVAPAALLEPRIQSLLRAQPLSHVVFELTEHERVADYDLLMRAIRQVKSMGALVAVDDAGAGYSSLQHILVLRPDFVKLDRALIAGLHYDEAKAALIEMFGGFSSRIDAWLLAEGVEEASELSRLIQLGVPLAQGYFMGKPAPTMRALDPGVTSAIASGVRDADRHVLAPLVEVAPSASDQSSDAALRRQLAASHACHVIPLLDAGGRAVALGLLAHGEAVERRGVTAVLATTPVMELLQRAMTRPRLSRFDPVVCCDESGRYLGLVRIERLIEAAVSRA
jgi:EAL domain-containing protein (putative c-di-GMP-specific phosphodiesterase class I)